MLFYDSLVAQLYRERLTQFYIEKSFPYTTVTTRIEEGAGNTVDLVFAITEGEKKPVEEIVFEGNTLLSDDQLKKVIQTRESWWILVKHEYDPTIVDQDVMRLRFTYWNYGYLDVQVEKGEVETIEDGLRINFIIDEGEPYTLGGITFQGNSIFTTEELLDQFETRPGDRFSFERLQNDMLNMINLYRGQGFLDIRIPPIEEQWTRDEVNKTVSLTIPVTEAPRKYLGNVEIQGVVSLDDGNVVPTQEGEFKTKDYVIRRELELEEGEPLDWTKVIESDRNLVNTGFFKRQEFPQRGGLNLKPGFERVKTIDPEVENLLLQLEEDQTGSLSFGGGVSTTFGPSVFATLSENNMFGYGVRGQITGELGEFRNRVQLSLFEPYLFGSDISLDWDIYYIDRRAVGGRTFDEERIGTSFQFGRRLTDEFSLLSGFKIENTDLSPEDGSRFDLDPISVPEEFNLGNNVTTSVTLGFSYDTRDFRQDPTSGVYTRNTVEIAGLTDNEFIKFRTLGNYYREVFDRLVFAISSEFELGHAYGDPGFLPLQERYFVGGANTVRGFDEGSIGDFERIYYKDPVLGNFRSYIGGEVAQVNNFEFRYAISEVFQAVSFVDVGTVWREIDDIDPSEYRVSTGVGLRMRIPFLNAIFRFDIPFVLRDFAEDDTELFHFSFGQTF